MRSKKNLLIVGGGSTYTIGFVLSLIAEKERFPLRSLVFYDNDEKRQEEVAQAASILLKERYPELESFSYTINPDEAFVDIDFAFIQIRTGGLAMREKDEQIPLRHGVVGQETCGPGGFAYGMRSIGDMVQLVRKIRQYSPQAWILNYTNPAAIVALALQKVFPQEERLLNICDMPVAIMLSYAQALGVSIWDLVPEYFGLNHFGWFSKISHRNGEDLTQKLKELILKGSFIPLDHEIIHDPSWQATFKQVRTTLEDFPDYLPNTYLQYYLYPRSMAAKEDPEHTRARMVMEGRERRVKDLYARLIATQTAKDEKLEADIHGIYMIRVAESLAYDDPQIYIVMTLNQGTISNISPDAMVEVPALVSPLGIKPFRVGSIPSFYKGLIENQHAYESLVVEAALTGSYQKALEALVLNRMVIDTPLAKTLLHEIIEANADFFQLK